MFIWTYIAHMALPLGEAGISEIPNESTVLSAMQSNIGDNTGLYIFPGLGVGKTATREKKTGDERDAAGVYTASYMLIEIVGFVLVGVTAALMLRKRSPAI